MKKFLALALSALLFVAAFAVPVAAVDWKDGQTTNEAGTYTFDNAYGFVFNVNSVNGTIAGEDATVITSAEEYNASNPNWAISVLLAPTSEANVYEVVTVVVTPGSAAAGMEKGINFDDGNIVLLVHSSGSLPEQTKEDGTVQTFANWQAKVAAMALKTGDKITLAGIDLEAATATSATATVQDAPEGYEVTNGVPEEPATVPEVITVDGDLSDNGWAADGWVEVTPENGYWQTIPTTDTLSYKYQLRTDDEKLYVAVEIDCAMVEGGNGNGTNVRFWINTDSEATVYTHFYDVCVKEGAVAYVAKYNTVKDGNTSADIADSSIDGVMTGEDGVTYVEFSVDLAEFNGAEGFDYFICVSNKVNENVCLYHPANDEPAEGESRTASLPYSAWNADKAANADVEALKLGEIEVEGGNTEPTPDPDPTPDPEVSLEDELKELVGEASADAKFDLEINAPESYKAGDEITVTVTVKNITAENGLHVVNFNLYYDNEKLVLTNDLDEEDDNRLLCIDDANLPSKWENFTKVNNDFDPANEEGTEVKALNDGVIYASALTDKDTASTTIKEDGAVVFTFTFTAVEDAEGDIGVYIPNAEVEGALNNAAG
ncbi:MAG: hypothetical protein IKT34_01790, partial [Clostridia bacterium]|nr:hypothetical protein [Clostridia bacterium]